MAEHLLGNVYQMATHPQDGACYLIFDTENQEHTLIDCGSTLSSLGLERQLKQEFDIDIDSIKEVHATHGHFDHVAQKTNMPNSRLYIHSADLGAVAVADPKRTAMIFYENEVFPPIINLEAIGDGYEKRIGRTALRAIETAGHSEGGICYEAETEEGSILIGGDTLEGCYCEEFGSNLDDWSNSLDKLANYRFDFVTFGHTISWLVPDAMAYLDRARLRFGVLIPSHEGRAYYPWARTVTAPNNKNHAPESPSPL